MMPSAMSTRRLSKTATPTPARPARTPRAESQAATRERLLQCAEQLVVSMSIPGLSLRQLCAEAGFTQGAFYANFDSRHALLLALSERRLAQQHASLAAVAHAVQGRGLADTLAALAGWLGELTAQREWAALAMELQLHAQRDAAFAPALKAANKRTAAAFAALLDDLVTRFDGRPAVPTPAAAQALFGLWHALALGTAPLAAGGTPARVFVVTLCALLGLPPPEAPTPARPARRKAAARAS